MDQLMDLILLAIFNGQEVDYAEQSKEANREEENSLYETTDNK